MSNLNSIAPNDFKKILFLSNSISDKNIEERLIINLDEIEIYSSFSRYSVSNTIFKKGLFIFGSIEKNITIEFSNCSFDFSSSESVLSEFRYHSEINLTFQNCKFHQFWFQGAVTNYIAITNCQFNYINIIDCDVSNFIILNNKSYTGSIITQSEKLNRLVVEGSFEKVEIQQIQNLEIRGDIKELELSISKFSNLLIGGSNSSDQLSKIDRFIFNSSAFEGNIHIRNSNIEVLSWQNLLSKSLVSFNACEIQQFELLNTDISNVYLGNLVIHQSFDFKGSNLIGLKLFNLRWPKNKTIQNSNIKKSICCLNFRKLSKQQKESLLNSIRFEREIYKQLKAATIANHNHIEALDFYRNEMRLYWKEIRLAGGLPIPNRILIFLDRWTSDFGQSWLLPIVWLFMFHGVWFSCLISWNYYENVCTGAQEFAEYAKLLNPTHTPPKYVSTGTGYLTDIIMRVSIGYFVYHIIKATRKYAKV